MPSYIFLTSEGYTQTPSMQDIENMQCLGWTKGDTPELAFENLKKENDFLLNSGFEDVVAMELKDETSYNFALN